MIHYNVRFTLDVALVAIGLCAGALVIWHHERVGQPAIVEPMVKPRQATQPMRRVAREVVPMASRADGPSEPIDEGASAVVTNVTPTPDPQAASLTNEANLASDNSTIRRQAVSQMIDRRYGTFLAEYAAKGKDADRLRAMLIGRQMIGTDILEAWRTQQGLNLMDSALRNYLLEKIGPLARDYEIQIKNTIGDVDYGSLQKYESMEPERTVVEELNRRLAGTGAELTDTQRAQLVDILFNTKEPTGGRRITNRFGPGQPTPPDPDYARVRVIPPGAIDALRGVLSVEQIAVFSAIAEKQHR